LRFDASWFLKDFFVFWIVQRLPPEQRVVASESSLEARHARSCYEGCRAPAHL
jgi:hypothetical protein